MSVYELPNVTVTPVGNIAYRIRANEGYYIKIPEYEALEYRTYQILETTYDFSTVQIVAESDLPEDCVINGGGGNNDHEVT